jgi:hypothetical protein
MFPTGLLACAARLAGSLSKGAIPDSTDKGAIPDSTEAMPNLIGDCGGSPVALALDSLVGVAFSRGSWPFAGGANQLNWQTARARSNPDRRKA